jgi:hypothetical protein
MKTRIERRLAATRLASGEVNGNAQTMQHTYGGFAHLRIKRIAQTRDKQGHACWSWPLRQPGHPGLSHALLFILVDLSEELLELLGQAIDFTLCAAQSLSVHVLQSNIAEQDPQENAYNQAANKHLYGHALRSPLSCANRP